MSNNVNFNLDKYKRLTANTGSNGIVDFDGISINVDATKFDVGQVKAWFVDNKTDPSKPTHQYKVFAAQTGITVTNILTANGSFIGINVSGTVIQQVTPFANAQTRTIIPLGGITHSNHITVTAVNDAPVIEYNLGLQFYDLMTNIGQFNVSGNVFASNGASLNITKTAGSISRKGDNYETNADDPHTITSAALSPVTFGYRNSTAAFAGASTTTVDPSLYESPLGTNTAVTTNKFTIQRIWLAPNDVVAIQYGQAQYTTMSAAIEALPNESYTANAALSARALLRAFMIVREGATDLSDTSQARLYANSRFADTATISATSVSTLQNVYDNSITPEVLTDSTRGAISVKRGSSADTDNVIEVLNGAGTVTASIKGNGNISGGVLTLGTDLALTEGGTGASTAADARTNLGLVAAGAGDIWVEKAGDTMTGALNIGLATGNALIVDTNTLVVDATNDRVGIGTASPAQRLDLALHPGLPGNLRLAQYAYFGLHYSSGDITMGYNAQADTALVNQTIVANTNGVVGYAYMKVGYPNGIAFHAISGSVTAGAVATKERMRIAMDGSVIINDLGESTADFRVEGDTDANLLFTDASADMVGIGTSTPGTKLSVEGVISTKAGTSTGQIAKVGGKISSNTTAVGNITTDEDDLMTYAVPANTLAANHDSLTFRASLVIANTVNVKRIRVKFGGTTFFDSGAAGIPISAALNIVVQGEIIRTGAATQICNVNVSTDNAAFAPQAGYATSAETLSGAVTLKITGEAISTDDISQKSMVVNWQPAP